MVCDVDYAQQEDVPFGNQASIIESRTRNCIQPIFYGVDYHEDPLEFKLIFGAVQPLDRYDLQRISMWLTGHQSYKWLSIDQPDLGEVCYRCIITALKPVSIGWLPYAMEATIRCDCPYAYSFPIHKSYTITGESHILFANESSVRAHLKPLLSIVTTATDFEIINQSDDGRKFAFHGLPSGEKSILADNAHGILTDRNAEYNLYEYFNMNFFRFIHGDNILDVKGTGTLTVDCRFLYNTAG